MKKLIVILTVLWLGLSAFANSVKADDYSKAVIGHVIQSKVNGTDVDVNALMSYELEKLAHKYSIEMVSILQAYLPAILDGVLTELKLEADEKYKCALPPKPSTKLLTDGAIDFLVKAKPSNSHSILLRKSPAPASI